MLHSKSNEKELTISLNSMFQWYWNAARCYVYLADVSVRTQDGPAPHVEWDSAFRNSRWFTQGWTLQELLAPHIVEFYSRDSIRLGDKHSLAAQIAEITGVPVNALKQQALSTFSIEERFSWVEKRSTTVKEDKAYCLLGIFDVFLSLIHGEGEDNAMRRLRNEIRQIDQSDTSNASIESKAVYSIPFMKNARFVGRQGILDQMEQIMIKERNNNRLTLVGLGGIGKTQLALAFAYHVKMIQPHRSVFWLPAISMTGFQQACYDLAKALNLKSGRDIREIVREYLGGDQSSDWLLIVDNVDDMDLLFGNEQHVESIHDYLPHSANGLILFTTRFQDIAISLESEVIEVDSLDQQEAIRFLEQFLAHNTSARKQLTGDKEAATKVLAELAFLPLAIIQAAAYFNKNKQLSLTGYLRLLQRTEQNFAFLSCIEPKAIPVFILPDYRADDPNVPGLATLCSYSFLISSQDEETYDMHRLVHLAARSWTKESGFWIETVQNAIESINDE